MILVANETELKISLVVLAREVLKLAEKLPNKNGMVTATTEFLSAIQKRMEVLGLSIDPSMAWQLWRFVCCSVDRQFDAYQIDAEIAWYYKINPETLSETAKLGLERNIARMNAQQTILEGKVDPADHKTIYDLYMTAFGDEELAQKAKTKAFARMVDKRTKEKS